MRLICPSCGAQYEVDDSVIPDAGRDVQCSNCGHAWFQNSAVQIKNEAHAQSAEADHSDDGDWVEAEAAFQDASVDPEPSPAVASSDDDTPQNNAPEATEVEETVAEPVMSPERKRRTLDDAVRNVLQEEAARESRARQSDGQSIETQPDLGLSAAAAPAAASAALAEHDRIARLRGDEDDLDEEALISRASRKELLPDIEEINSTLRATSERGDEAAAMDAPETLRRRRFGFRFGFSTAVIIAGLALGLYLLAPTLSERYPAMEPSLTSYLQVVEPARIWLDAALQSLTASLNGAAGS